MARGNFKLEDQRQAVTQAPQARPVNPHGMASTGQALQSFGAQLMHEGGNRAAQFVAAEKTSYFNRSSAVLKQKTAEFETQATLKGERNLQKATNDFVDKMTQDLLADAPSEEAASQFIDNVAMPYKSERLASIHKVESEQRAALYAQADQQAMNISGQTIEAHPELYEQSVNDIKTSGKSLEGVVGLVAARKITDEALTNAQILRIQGITRDNPLAALAALHQQEHTDRIPSKTFHGLAKAAADRLNQFTSIETIADFKEMPYKTTKDVDKALALIESRKGLMDQPTYHGVVSKFYDWTKEQRIQVAYNEAFERAEKTNTPLAMFGEPSRVQKYAQSKVDTLRDERAEKGQPPPTFREETDLRKTTNSNDDAWNSELSTRLNQSDPKLAFEAAEVLRDAKQTNPAFVAKVPQADQDLARVALENKRARPEMSTEDAMEEARDFGKPENKERAQADDDRLKADPRFQESKLGSLLAREAFIFKNGVPDASKIPGDAIKDVALDIKLFNRQTHNTAKAAKMAIDKFKERFNHSGAFENNLIENSPTLDKPWLNKGHILPQASAAFVQRKAQELGETLSPDSPLIPPNTPLTGLFATDYLKGKQPGIMRDGVKYTFDIESDERTQDADAGNRTYPVMLVNTKTGQRSKWIDHNTKEAIRLVLPSEAEAMSDPLLKNLPKNEQESLDYAKRTFLEKAEYKAAKGMEYLNTKVGKALGKGAHAAVRHGGTALMTTRSLKASAVVGGLSALEGFISSLYSDQTDSEDD